MTTLACWLSLLAAAAPAGAQAVVGPDGVMRWAGSRTEVAVFGVNYYPPCSIDYHVLKELRLDPRKVIDQDLLHLQRLGLTALRLHVFDREISDRAGNLLDNEHLALLDHLIAAAAQRGFHTILTPIAWWQVPGESPGFSTFFPMPQMVSDPGEPRAAQCRYLQQFMRHRNAETGQTYGEDPAILCFELINEPIYPPNTTDDQVVEYVDALAAAVRSTGCRKPIFYNGWGARLAALGRSSLDGVTFGWYPTGLVSGGMLTANYLSRVNDFPSMRDGAIGAKAKGVYEFDAADVPFSYLYPAMARAFRSGGAQFACQFQYDAWPLAATNVNWQTHFLTLPYAPGKALSFKIAAEVFRRVPRLARYGDTPRADHFGPFRVSYAQDLSELVTATEFYHSNATSTQPPEPAKLEHLAGVGSSPVVGYEGSGAWFLDRLGAGNWRLEVYPDCVWVDDPFGATQLGREAARLVWCARSMTVRLPDLGPDFAVLPLDPGNTHRAQGAGGRCVVQPGVYQLVRRGAPKLVAGVAEYFAPPADPALPLKAFHRPPDALIAGDAFRIQASRSSDPGKLTLCYQYGETWRRVGMRRERAYRYAVELPREVVQPGTLRYALVAEEGGSAVTFPGGLAGWPEQLGAGQPRVVFDAAELAEAPKLTMNNNPGATGASELAGGAVRMSVSRFDPAQDSVAAVRFATTPLAGPAVPVERLALRLRARATAESTHAVEVGLLQDDGSAYGVDLGLSEDWTETDVPVTSLRPLWSTRGGRLDVTRLKEVQLTFGRWLFGGAAAAPHGVELASIAVVPRQAWFEVPVEPVGPPVELLRPAVTVRQRVWQEGGGIGLVTGPGGKPALTLTHKGFGPPPDSIGFSGEVATNAARRAAMAQCDTLRLTVRGRTAAARRLEVVLSEDDGAPFGTVIELPSGWGTVDLPLKSMRWFAHWPHPDGRGAEGDALRPEHVQRWHLTFGAWLSPEHAAEPHVIDVAGVELSKAPE